MTDLSDRIAGLSEKKRALLAQRLRAEPKAAASAIPRRDGTVPVRLSFAQERLWFLDRWQPGNAAYNLLDAVRLVGPLDVPALAAALAEVERRHESLRTVFVESGGIPYQVVNPAAAALLPLVDLSALPPGLGLPAAQAFARAAGRVPFELARGPLWRARLLRLGDEEHVLVLVMHHAVTDLWSFGILVRELGALYSRGRAGGGSPLPELPIQYPDFAVWQRGRLTGELLERELAFWRQQLQGAPVSLDLPTDRPRPAVQGFAGALLPFTLPPGLLGPLKALAQEANGTLFMVAWAAFSALLSRYSGQRDLLLGSVLAGRTRREVEPLMGLFVNTVVLRADLTADPSFRDLLARARETVLEAFANQDLPFEKLVEELQPERDPSRAPLVQVLFALQNAPVQPLELHGLSFTPYLFDTGTAKLDLSLFLTEEDGALLGALEYSTELFDAARIERLAGHLRELLAAVAADPGRRLSELPLLSPAERRQLVADWNDTARAYPPVACLHHLFEAQADRTPEAVAVRFEERVLTYRELDAAGNRLACLLRAQGVGPEVVVGVLLDRSLEMVVALFGVLKAGGAYLPLDPSYPMERLAAFVEDAAPRLVLTVSALAHLVPAGTRGIFLDAEDELAAVPDAGRPEAPAGPGSLAYVIFTSGSTGRPKGAMNAHRGIVNRILWMQEAYGLGADDRVLQKTPFSFDVSVWEFFWPLAVGARLVLARPEGHRDPAYLVELIAREGITTLHFVPSMLQAFLEAPGLERCASVRRVITSGEELTAEVAARCLDRLGWAELHNLYGPTEAAVDVTAWPCRRGELGMRVPIGRPIANLRVHLLDGWEPVPVGVPGELFIGGVGVGRGYLGRPALTAERFVPDPFSPEPGGRLYRTGDLARHRADGAVDFLGRIDHQVKIRGFRIELGEIESALAQAPGVKAAVVGVREARDDRQLVAYLAVAGSAAPAPGELRELLRSRLPEAMIPAAFVLLDALPLNPNGKVDRKALARLEPEVERRADADEGQRTPRQELVAGIWSEVLGLERIGTRESFFELGGHSLLATRVIARVREIFGVELPLPDFFESPTVEGLAARIEELGRTGSAAAPPPLRPVPRAKLLPLSLAQERLWFLDQLEPGSSAYNVAMEARLAGRLSVSAFAEGLREIVRRQGSLRTTFEAGPDGPVQVVHPPGTRPASAVPLLDLTGLPAASRPTLARQLASGEARRPFDLAAGPLFRAALLRLDAEDHVWLLTMHQIVADDRSAEVFRRELAALYAALLEGRPSPLPDLPVQYADFSAWQRGWLAGAELERQLEWWRERLAGAPAVLELPADRPRPPIQSYRGGAVPVALGTELSRAVVELGRRGGATSLMVLLAGFQALLGRLSGQEDLVVGSPVANRRQAGVEGLIGSFVNTLALRCDLAGDPSFADLLARARASTLAAYAHQDVPFERLVEVLQPERSLAHAPLFQVMLALESAPGSELELPGLRLSPLVPLGETAKLDLHLTLSAGGSGMAGALGYALDLFDRSTAERMVSQLAVLLEAAAARPELSWLDLPLFTEGERRQLLAAWAATGEIFSDGTLADLFAAQAARTPGAEALVVGEERLTYAELAARAGALARHLRRLGVGPEERVAVCAERSADLIVALLAVLQAGGAYVPIDPAYPRERQLFMLEDARAGVLLTQEALLSSLPGATARVVLLDRPLPALPEHPGEPAPEPLPESLAYFIYTSGSTGRPKGVAIAHRSAVAMVRWARQVYSDEELSGVLLATSVCFDLSVYELFVPLAWGGRVILAENALALPALPARDEVALVNTVPSAMAELVRTGGLPASVRTVNLAGEALQQSLVDRIYGLGTVERVWNLYGPSEDTTYSTFVLTRAGGGVTIGRPLPGTRAYVLDRRGRPAPPGVPGELHLGGVGLARGYFDRPDLTAERFVPDEWGGEPGARLYRTGDLARWLPREPAELEFLGRIDHQVKVRGFRIELGEVEAALLAHSGVRETVCLAREDRPGDRRLVAYVVGQDGPPPAAADLREHLRQRLPEHMVPALFVALSKLPLSPNGKVDRKALPAPEAPAESAAYEAPRTPAEELVAGIFAEVLGCERVGVGESFFDLGGHSLLATGVLSRLREAGVEVRMRALFEAPTVAALARSVEAAAPADLSLRSIRRAAERHGPASDARSFPASFSQERLWFLDRLEPGSHAYNIADALQVEGAFDVAAFAASVREIVRRHEALRTTFRLGAEGAEQVIAPPEPPPALPVVDLAALPEPLRGGLARRLAEQEAMRPFDLERGPLLRVALVRSSPAKALLLCNMHHIVSDGWSMGVFFRELATLYQAFASRRRPVLPELPVQYSDYAVWQRSWLRGEVLAGELAHWRSRLAGAPPVLELPWDRPRSAGGGRRSAARDVVLDDRLARAAHALGRREQATLFMTLLSSFAVLLHRLSGQEDLCVGTPVAGRGHLEIEGLIGFFVNTLVIRSQAAPDLSFRQLLGRVRGATLDAYQHQDLPFEKLVEELQPERSLAYSPLFQVMFVLQNAPLGDEGEGPKPGAAGEPRASTPASGSDAQLIDRAVAERLIRQLEMPGLRLTPMPLGANEVPFDLVLTLLEYERGIVGTLGYDGQLLEGATAERLLRQWRTVLAAAVERPDVRWSELPLLDDGERQQALAEWSGTEPAAGVPPVCLHQLFEAKAAQTPESEALVVGEERLGYAELERRSRALAAHLRARGVGPEVVVGVCAERSASLVIGLLGILRSGGAYVPLDPAYPRERRETILEDSGAAVLLASQRFMTEVEAWASGRVAVLDLDELASLAEAPAAAEPGAGPHHLAYLIYTSGSTGRPKGVAIEHRSAVALAHWAREAFEEADWQGVLFSTSINFDLSIFELFVPLAWGGKVILAADALALPSLPAAGEVTLVNTVPSALAELAREGTLPSTVRTVNLAGEPLPRDLADRIYALPGVERLYNLYGPSEDTTYSTWVRVPRDGGKPSIGRPVSGTRALVLDRWGQPSPVGAFGELFLGGAGLARGYWRRPDLTAERFVPAPFGVGERLYRTGDLVRWRPDGELDFLGRIDTQVKVRGFRIELGEVESVLLRCPGVHQAAVLALGEGGDRRLVAFVAAEGPAAPSADELRAVLAGRLPSYMVPVAIAVLEALPLTPNGKVDRRALAGMEPTGPATAAASRRPRGPVAEAVAAVWEEVLGRPVGAGDDFFDLGGHSLLATRVASRLSQVFGAELPLRALFEHTTVDSLTARLEMLLRDGAGGASGKPALERAPRPFVSGAPLSFAQERLWFLDRLDPGNAAYNIPAAVRLSGRLEVGALRASIQEIVRRHEVLRGTFVTTAEGPVQWIAPPAPVPLPVVDLEALPVTAREAEAERLAAAEASRPFDLAGGPLLRLALARLEEAEHLALLTFHHIAADAWSLGLFAGELGALYAAFTSGRRSPLPELAWQYADFALWQRRWLQGEVLERQLAFWKSALAGAPTFLALPADRPRPPVQRFRGRVLLSTLPAGLVGELRAVGRRRGATLFMSLLSGLGALLSRYTAQDDLLVGTPVADRPLVETEGLIGLFLNTLALRIDLAGAPGLAGLVERVREVTFAAYAHRDLPFEKLVEELALERNLSHSPLFQVMLVLHNEPPGVLELPGLRLSLPEVEGTGAKFDLVLNCDETDDGLTIRWIYNSDLYDAARITRMAGHLERLLEAAVADPERRVGELPLLTGEEERQLLAWNDSDRDLPLARGFVELFRERAASTPEAVAAVCGGEAVTYDELDRRTERLGQYLAGLGAGEEGVVAVLAERGLDLLSAMIALFKAGLAYLPLDPGHPAHRHAQVLRESRTRFVVASEELAPVVAEAIASLPAEARPELLGLPDPAAPVAAGPLPGGEPLRLAYVIFTSGSTGVPKGAMVAHVGMANHLFAKIGDLDLGAGDVVAQTASQCFDISVWQFLAALVVGGRVEIFPDEIAQNPALLLEESRRRGVTILETVPSLLRALVEEAVHPSAGNRGAGALRWMIPTGEALPPDLCNRWLELFPRIPLMNAYGPTECSDDVTHCTLWRPLPAEAATVPIGRPVANMRLHVVSRGFDLQPVGVPGELCVGGAGVGRGYLNDPLRTAGVFVPDPFAGQPGARLYRTGDLARWLPSGEIEFLGRIDHQVKVRGFRIELGEIESTLAAHRAVREAVVLAREQRSGERRLVAYLGVRGEAPAAAELAAFLGRRIPEYMVPSAFVCLPALPLTANGKVDRKALPEPEEQARSTELVAPRNALEEHLAGHFRELLKRDEVGVHDDFFDLGGSSISGAVLINRLQRELGEIVHVVVLFDAPTIEKLAAYLVREHPQAVARRWGVETLAGRPAEGAAEARVDEVMVAEMRRLIRPPAPRPHAAPKNPRAVFLLSPPRSGSTLLRVLLAGHPELFAPPELELLSFDTLAERRAAFPGRDAFWLEGAIRTVMEAKPCGVEEARAFLEAREAEGWTSRQLYRQLQEWIGGRTLIDKTPSYALDLEILRRAEEDFEAPLYIHLLRHPGAVVRSFEEAKLDQLFFRAPHRFSRRQLAELIWLVSHQNILELLSGVDPRRQLRVRFEDLVRAPEPVLAEICRLIGVELHPDMLDPYKEKRSRMTDGLHAESRMLGDVKFHQHRAVDAEVAEQWREHLSEESLGDPTWSMAEALGYQRRTARPIASAGRPGGFSSLVLLQEGRPSPPLFLVHPVGGNVLCYGQLARRLGHGQPIYGLQSAGLGNGHPHATVEQMAAHYLDAVRQAQPRGPYRLAGWSIGGTIAFEMARRLEQAGEEVELLALLDSVAPGVLPGGEPEAAELLLGLARDLAGLAGREDELASESLEGLDPDAAVARILGRAQELGALPADLDPDQVERLWQVFRANATAARRYVPGPYRGRTVVMASAHNPFRDTSGLDLGWGRLAADVETELLDADHYGLLREPAVLDLAERLRARLTPSAAGRP